ncbi:DUF6153 family protein [Microbacterium sp. SS28]|uniref:DUF6153 family protein n=1 Tax=Microbacterium sp. SS28 TaxID=2919948 RepID=UPI001FAAC0D1|nr:DUF6153 family protein [Microbacterium sp. SS28]
MRTIRAILQSRSSLTRVLIGVALTLGVIVGLLAMHTLSGGDASHGHSPAGVAAVADSHAPSMHDPSGVADPELCDCGTSGPVDGHSMLAMACVLGLLITVLILAIPKDLGRVDLRAPLLGLTTEVARRALARARPPSLYVLSISRT